MEKGEALELMAACIKRNMKGLTPHITGSKKQSEERAALLAVRVHVIVGHLSISAETLMAQVDQVSSIPDSSALLTSVAPRVGKFESLGVSENLLQ